MNKLEHKVVYEDWDCTCSDGCCYDFGTTLTVNGHEINRRTSTDKDELRMILDALGLEYDIEEK